MPYKVIGGPAVDVLEKIGEIVDADGKTIGLEHKTNTWVTGDLIPDEKVSPVVVEAYSAGDSHVTSLLKKITKAAAAKADVEETEE
jgi:hypothetical protein